MKNYNSQIPKFHSPISHLRSPFSAFPFSAFPFSDLRFPISVLPFSVLCLAFLFSGQAWAAKRTALVIGNAGYRNAPLSNPVNDARDVGAVLKRIGFDVILKLDADKGTMKEALRSFRKKLSRSEIGLFYYAGHGMQINGTNYLIPVKNNIREEWEVESEALSANRFLAAMQAAGSPMNIVILDACRDNPFKRSFRTSEKGLAKMDAPPGTVIAYATSAGSVAADGTGRNGTYTAALLENIQAPGMDVQRMFNQTGLDVMRQTRNTQVPWLSTTPIPEYFLAGGSVVVESPTSPGNSGSGRLHVESDPAGADIFVKGQFRGKSPVDLKDMAEGSYTILARLKGYQDETKNIRVNSGRKALLSFVLDPVKTGAKLYVTTQPEDCRIRILNIGPAFYNGMELEKGKYKLEVSKSGYETKVQWVVIDSGQGVDLYVELEKGERRTENGDRKTENGNRRGTYTDPVTGMEFVWVQGGCFQMGDTFGGGDSDEKPVHEVCVDGFWMGKYEVTQGEWEKIMGSNPSQFKGSRRPVEQVSWNDCQEFIRKLNSRSGKRYRLAYEAEWEYAARSGGKNEKYSGGNNADPVAWYGSNSGGRTHDVGTKASNGLGIYDMSGNVYEWCEDWYGENYYGNSPRNNPEGPGSGSDRVFRGGSWDYIPGDVPAAFRGWLVPGNRYSILGFRLVLPVQQGTSR